MSDGELKSIPQRQVTENTTATGVEITKGAGERERRRKLGDKREDVSDGELKSIPQRQVTENTTATGVERAGGSGVGKQVAGATKAAETRIGGTEQHVEPL